jgi:hypothetical protein
LPSPFSSLHKHRKPLLSVLGLALLGVAMFVSVVRGPRDSFDQKTWLEANSMEAEIKCLRGRMVRHLREHVLRSGMERDAVIALLGPSHAAREGELAFGLGYCSSPAEGSSLIVHFDRDGRLTHTSLAGM